MNLVCNVEFIAEILEPLVPNKMLIGNRFSKSKTGMYLHKLPIDLLLVL